jgi:poly(hydroxyalkanoate) granule-associated protein
MVKKLKKIAEKQTAGMPAGLASLLENQLGGTVKDSAQQIWLAGLGAFAKAQEEGGKVFEALVREGVSLQRKTTAVAEEKLGEVTSRMTGLAGDVGAKAGQHWDKLENLFEERVARALNKLGVPSHKDVAALIERIDELAAAVAKSEGKPAPRRAAKAAAAPAEKPAKAARAAKPKAAKAAKAEKAPVAKAPAKRVRKPAAAPVAEVVEAPAAEAAPAKKAPAKRVRKPAAPKAE